MSYAVGVGPSVDPISMNELVNQYNSAPHSTLTRYGPSFDVSPKLAQSDKRLEEYICRRISQANMEVKQTQDFELPTGSKVYVFMDISPLDKRRSSTRPEIFTITGFSHGVYSVQGTKSGVKLSLPRFKIKPVQK
jgi:hypothetical protein